MPETLLDASSVLLFGSVLEDLHVKPGEPQPRPGTRGILEQQLQADDPRFARIYGFGQAGIYRLLTTPALFLVHGPGEPAADLLRGLRPTHAGESASEPVGPLLPEGLSAWKYDKADYTIRLDVRTGTFDQLLNASGPESRGMSVQGMSVPGMSVRGMSLRDGDKD